jgi:hypothetical protein
MTLVDVKNALFSHFLVSHTFSLKDDVSSLQLDTSGDGEGLVAHLDAIVKAALDDFARTGMVAIIAPDLYILSQPLDTFQQQVTLTPMAAEMVTDLVNEYMTCIDGPRYVANKLSLTSHDIEILCHYCHFLLDEDTMAGDPDLP